MIRVVVDGRRLQDQPLTGVGRCLAGYLPHLTGRVRLTVLTDRRRPAGAANGLGDTVALPAVGPETVWLQAAVPAWLSRHRPDVFHGTFNAVPLATTSGTVVSIYDLAWIDHPEDFTAGRRAVFAAHARWAVHHSAVVLTVSRFTRDRLIDAYGLAPDRVEVTPVAVPVGFGLAAAGLVRDWLARKGVTGNYIVAIGGARRRGLAVAVEAWRRLDERPDLVVVGRETPLPEPGLVAVGSVDDRTWAGILAGADALLYPTRFEGFGLPALEAMASGTPVVCARVAALPEVLGGAAEWADGTGAEEMSEALARVLGDKARQDELRRRGLARAAAAPSWADVAETVLDAYERAAT